MTKSYHNTTPEKGQALLNFEAKALTQDEIITRFFLQRKGKNYTPSEVLKRCFSSDVPITSVRRSITNLTNQGLLKQTGVTRSGLYGRNENAWTYA